MSASKRHKFYGLSSLELDLMLTQLQKLYLSVIVGVDNMIATLRSPVNNPLVRLLLCYLVLAICHCFLVNLVLGCK
jgi:hypothetical protein